MWSVKKGTPQTIVNMFVTSVLRCTGSNAKTPTTSSHAVKRAVQYSILPTTPERLICGNKMPTRCNRGFYCRSYCLLNMFRALPCPSSGAQEYYTVVAACGILCCGFSSSWSGVELRVMRPVCRMLQHPANRTHNPQLHTRPAT